VHFATLLVLIETPEILIGFNEVLRVMDDVFSELRDVSL